MCVSACGACLRLYTQSAGSLSTIICLVIIIIISSGFSWYEITGLGWAQKSWWPSLEFTDDSLFLQQLSRNSCGRCLRLFFFFRCCWCCCYAVFVGRDKPISSLQCKSKAKIIHFNCSDRFYFRVLEMKSHSDSLQKASNSLSAVICCVFAAASRCCDENIQQCTDSTFPNFPNTCRLNLQDLWCNLLFRLIYTG